MLNVKKLLVKLLPNVDSNYIKFCGFGACWGFTHYPVTANVINTYTVNFPIEFANENYGFSCVSNQNTQTPQNLSFNVGGQTTTSINVLARSTTTTEFHFRWLAVGKVA